MAILQSFWKPRAAPPELKLFELPALIRQPRLRNEALIRALCATIPIREDLVLSRVLGRYKMFLDPRDYSVSAHLMLDGYWEMWLTEALSTTVQRGMRAVDVGANSGYFTLLLAELVGDVGHVHSFEPNSWLRERIGRSASVNGFLPRVSLHADPLGDVDGDEVILSWDHDQAGGAHVHSGDQLPREFNQVLLTRRLDSYPELLDADVLKIDAEGSEQAIWRGAAGIFARRRPMTIFLEFTACRYAEPGAFLDEITAQGFAVAEVSMKYGVRPMTRADVLAAPATDDMMLMLVRN